MLLQLDSVQLAAPLNQTGECLLLTELVLPRNGIARKSSLNEVHLVKGRRSFIRVPFYEKALFKEKVEGHFGIKVSVTRPLKHPELNQFMKQLIAAGISGLGEDASTSAFPSLSLPAFAKGLRDLVQLPFDTVSNVLESDSPTFIASGGIDLDSRQILSESKDELLISSSVTIPLSLNSRLRLSDAPVGPKAREKRKTSTKLYKKGSTVGSLILDLSV